MRIKEILFGGAGSSTKLGDVGLLVARLAVGLMMAYLHGRTKWPPSPEFIKGVRNLGFPAPAFFAWSAALAEILGGLCIAAGLFTRPAAFFVGFTMAVAAFGRHASDPLKAKELALLYLAMSILLLFTGAGRFSLDGLFRKK